MFHNALTTKQLQRLALLADMANASPKDMRAFLAEARPGVIADMAAELLMMLGESRYGDTQGSLDAP